MGCVACTVVGCFSVSTTLLAEMRLGWAKLPVGDSSVGDSSAAGDIGSGEAVSGLKSVVVVMAGRRKEPDLISSLQPQRRPSSVLLLGPGLPISLFSLLMHARNYQGYYWNPKREL